MFALADVNSFYASCQEVFQPEIKSQPIVILSNNDGNVIARSAAAKRLGIKMGVPWFQLKKQQFPVKIHCYSSNYALYANMSSRVMTVLERLAPRSEIYSIDECFLDLSGVDNCISFEDFGRQVRRTVLAHTGLTVGVGCGVSKTLAKSAQWASKEWPQFGGVLALTPDNPRRTEKLLSLQPVEEVWGCGRRISQKLATLGIKTALDLSRADVRFIRKHFSIVLERTVRELRGEPCIGLEDNPPAKQQIVCSRSFGRRVETYDELRQAICRYAARAGEKLREQGQFCRHVSVFIKTSPFSPQEPYYANVSGEKLIQATRDTRDIIAAAVRGLERIWRPGLRYAKAGIMLNDFSTSDQAQLGLFDDVQPRPGAEKLMKVMDGINNSSLGSIWFAGQGIDPGWVMKREMLSPEWTTQWKDIPVAHIR